MIVKKELEYTLFSNRSYLLATVLATKNSGNIIPIVNTAPMMLNDICSKNPTCHPILPSTISISFMNLSRIRPGGVISKNWIGAWHTDLKRPKKSRLEARRDPRY